MDERSCGPLSQPGRRAAVLASKILRGQISDPTPEERLWLAVIEQAVREAYADLPADEERRAEARRWLDSEDFDEVATSLGLHPQWARDTIRKLDGIGETRLTGDASSRCAA